MFRKERPAKGLFPTLKILRSLSDRRDRPLSASLQRHFEASNADRLTRFTTYPKAASKQLQPQQPRRPSSGSVTVPLLSNFTGTSNIQRKVTTKWLVSSQRDIFVSPLYIFRRDISLSVTNFVGKQKKIVWKFIPIWTLFHAFLKQDLKALLSRAVHKSS